MMISAFARPFRWICLAALIAPLAAAQSPFDLPPLPEDLLPQLRPILKAALSQSPQMIQSNISIASAEATRIQDRAGMLPSVYGSANYSANKTAIASNVGYSSTSSGLFYNLSLNQPIFQWNALKNRNESGKIGVKIAQHQYAEAYRLLLVQLRSQYLSLVTMKITVRNAEYALKQAQDALALAEVNLKAGKISPEAMMDPRLAVEQARLARDRAIENLANAKRLFLLQAGVEQLSTAKIPDEVPQPTYKPKLTAELLQRFIDTGADDTPTALTYKGYIRQADLDYRIARVNLLPKFSFSASIGQQNVTTAGANYVNQEAITTNTWNIIGSWAIFDGLATRGAKMSALTRRRMYERTLKNHVAQDIDVARDLDKKLDFAWRDEQIVQTRHDVSLTQLQRAENELKTGKTSQTAVDNAQSNAYQMDLNLAGARSEFLNEWSQFLSAICVDPMLNQVPASYLTNGK